MFVRPKERDLSDKTIIVEDEPKPAKLAEVIVVVPKAPARMEKAVVSCPWF